MATVTTVFVRLTDVSASGGSETKELSPGAAGTNFNGSLSFAANSLHKGDVIRITAWGRFNNSNTNFASARARL
jgi:hypothetical protein